MPTAAEALSLLESLAVPLAAGAGFAYVLRRLGAPVPAGPLAKFLAVVAIALGGTAFLGSLGRERLGAATFGLLTPGLAAFLFLSWRATADARLAYDEKVRRARGQERKRAQGNVPPGGTGTGHTRGSARPTAGGPP